MATTVVVQAVQEDTCLPVGELRLQESGQAGRALLLPHPGQVLPYLPYSRSPSDDRSLPTRRHHRYDELTWNGQTLPLIGWSQRTGIHVVVLLRRCRRGWSVEQVLTTPLGEDRSGPHPT